MAVPRPVMPLAPGPQPMQPRRPWWRAVAAGAVLVSAIAATAIVTYAATRQESPGSSAPASSVSPPAQAPQYSAAEQGAAKERVCHIFDVSTRGLKGQGGVRTNGELNVPVVLRILNGVVALQDALSPATPPRVAAAAHKYISTNLDLTTAAMSDLSIEEGNRLNDLANDAIDEMVAACGLGH